MAPNSSKIFGSNSIFLVSLEWEDDEEAAEREGYREVKCFKTATRSLKLGEKKGNEQREGRKGKEKGKGKERKGKERKGKERKGKERKGKRKRK